MSQAAMMALSDTELLFIVQYHGARLLELARNQSLWWFDLSKLNHGAIMYVASQYRRKLREFEVAIDADAVRCRNVFDGAQCVDAYGHTGAHRSDAGKEWTMGGALPPDVSATRLLCGNKSGNDVCVRDPGHSGAHWDTFDTANQTEWDNPINVEVRGGGSIQCGARFAGAVCNLPQGHEGEHNSNARQTQRVGMLWPNESMQREGFETNAERMMQKAWEDHERCVARDEALAAELHRQRTRPSVLYQPSLINNTRNAKWLAVYHGVPMGNGDTPEKAMRDFDEKFNALPAGDES